MKRLATAILMLSILLLWGSAEVRAQGVQVFSGGESAYQGAPNVPHIFMFESMEADTTFLGSYGFNDGDPRDYNYWEDFTNVGGTPQQGEGALWLDWGLWSDQDWGGSSALQHFLPDSTDRLYDFSDFTHLHLWHNTLVPADPPANLRIKLHDASEGLGTAPTSETEDWYSEFSTVYQEQPGWKLISLPLVDLGPVSPGSGGLSRPGCPTSCWSGLWGNGQLDLDKIAGFQIEFTGPQYGPTADSSTAGTIVFDNMYVTGVRYDLVYSFDNGVNGSWVNGSGSHSTAVVADTVEGTGALEFTYNMVGDLSWGGSVDLELLPTGGDFFPQMDDNTHLSLFYKVLEPADGDVRLVFQLFDASLPGHDWQYSPSNVLTDESGQWRRMKLPLDAFAVPSWQNPPGDAKLNPNTISRIIVQVTGGSGAQGAGKILFDRFTTYGEQETDFEAPDAVTGLDVTTSDMANIVSWNDVPGEENETYTIYFSPAPITDIEAEGVMVVQAGVQRGTEVLMHPLFAPVSDQQVTYYYAITATDRAGNTSEPTMLGSAVTNMAKGLVTISLSPPVNFVADGNLSEWSGITPIHVAPGADLGHVPPGFVVTDAQDLSADVYVAVDDEALYVAFDVTDNAFHPEAAGTTDQRWMYDNVELFIGLYDWRGAKHRSLQSGAEPDYQILMYGSEVHSNSTDGAIFSSGDANYIMTASSKGYVVELKLPYDSFAWTEAPVFEPKNGMRIPFDFKIHDDDRGGGQREGIIAYSFDDDDNSHESPQYWFYTWIGDAFSVGVEQIGTDVPRTYVLEQNYPNPFNPETLIRYSLPKAGDVSIRVYNVLGQEVRTLLDAQQAAGNYEVRFDASSLPSGVYFYQLRSGSFVQSKTMMLVR